MINKVILMGRLTRDPELRHTQNNQSVTSFTLAIDRRAGANGERQTDFINCVAWGKQADFVHNWFEHGALAIVVGRVQSRNWEDKNGNKRVSVEVVAGEVSFGETKAARARSGQAASLPPTGSPDADGFSELQDDGDVPF